MIPRIHSVSKLLICIPLVLVSVSCFNQNSSPKFKAPSVETSSSSSSTPVEVKKDAGKEFRSITDRTYYDAESALRDVDSFISTFNSDNDAWNYVEDMKDIRRQLKEMNQFFSKYYYSCKAYKEAADEVSSDFKGSEWSLVRTVWNKQFESKYDELIREVLADIDADSFRSYMVNDAERRCMENYEKNGPLGIGYMLSHDRSTEVVSISDPVQIDGKSGKKAEGVFRVHMEGSLGMGHRVGSVKIRIKGELGITTEGDLQYHSLDYDIIERTGSLQ